MGLGWLGVFPGYSAGRKDAWPGSLFSGALRTIPSSGQAAKA